MQFVVIAYDGTDSDAPARRTAVREAHLESARRMRDAGEIIKGGAILDEEGAMMGSVIFVEFPSREALDAWLEADPYVTGGVWLKIDVLPFRVAV